MAREKKNCRHECFWWTWTKAVHEIIQKKNTNCPLWPSMKNNLLFCLVMTWFSYAVAEVSLMLCLLEFEEINKICHWKFEKHGRKQLCNFFSINKIFFVARKNGKRFCKERKAFSKIWSNVTFIDCNSTHTCETICKTMWNCAWKKITIQENACCCYQFLLTF